MCVCVLRRRIQAQVCMYYPSMEVQVLCNTPYMPMMTMTLTVTVKSLVPLLSPLCVCVSVSVCLSAPRALGREAASNNNKSRSCVVQVTAVAVRRAVALCDGTREGE